MKKNKRFDRVKPPTENPLLEGATIEEIYGEFVPSTFLWIRPEDQRERVDYMVRKAKEISKL